MADVNKIRMQHACTFLAAALVWTYAVYGSSSHREEVSVHGVSMEFNVAEHLWES